MVEPDELPSAEGGLANEKFTAPNEGAGVVVDEPKFHETEGALGAAAPSSTVAALPRA